MIEDDLVDQRSDLLANDTSADGDLTDDYGHHHRGTRTLDSLDRRPTTPPPAGP